MPGARSSSAELRVAIQRPAEVIALQARARAFAAAAGLANVACWEVAIAVSEAATNMLKFAGGGVVTLRAGDSPRPHVEIEAQDRGGGIAHLEEALVDNISEGVDAREDPRGRRGLGLGLGAIQRLMDEVEIDSAVGEGTTIRARKWIRAGT
ncbi:MAG: ATP-binding protein [Nannocystaceae bacterium]